MGENASFGSCFLQISIFRNYVGYQLLGRDAVTVPFLDEAYHFVPFGVIVKRTKRVSFYITHIINQKKTKKMSKLMVFQGSVTVLHGGSDKSSYAIIGSMAHVLAPRVDRKPFQQKPERVYDYNFNDK